MSQPSIFDSETPLPSDALVKREKTLLGFSGRYARVHDQLRLLLNVGGLVLSYYFNITSGAAIILAGVLLYAIVLLLPGAKRRWGGEKTMAA